MNRNNSIKLFFSFFLTIVLGYFLIRQIKLGDILSVITSIPFNIIALSFLLYVFSYIFRTLRFKLMLKKISFIELFKVVCLHNMFNGLLPFRTGELSFIYLASKKGETKEKATSSLIIARFFDFIIIFILFVLTIMLSGTKDPRFILYSEIFFIAIALFILSVFISGFFFRHIKKAAASFPIVMKIVLFAENIADNLKEMGDIKKSIGIGLVSVLVWICNYGLTLLIVYAMGITLSIYSMIIAITFTILINTMPIHGLVSFGTMETGWVVSFMIFNVDKALAISSGFAFHIINILFFMVMGVVGILSYGPDYIKAINKKTK